MSDFIDDGYTEKGYIEAEEGVHGSLEFEYRPIVPSVRDRVHDNKDPEKFIAAVARVLGRDANLKEWSMVDRKGEPVKITEANVQKIKPRLFDKLWGVVAGWRPSDKMPDGTQPKQPDLENDSKN